jgi:hypothetical protein
MTVIYLITVTAADAAHVDRWAETGLRLCPAAGHPGFGVAAVDVVRNPEGG